MMIRPATLALLILVLASCQEVNVVVDCHDNPCPEMVDIDIYQERGGQTTDAEAVLDLAPL